MFTVGDIVEIFVPQTGYRKFHLCVHAGAGEGDAHKFLFLNSDPTRLGSYVVDCARVPCLTPSRTGKTAFSFNMVPRYSDRQLKLYRAKKLGTVDAPLAADLHRFSLGVTTLARSELLMVRAALKGLAGL